ncbi:MAG: HEXXH motif-containing putative peptide modification protein [Bdellovibrionales bacterium]
MKVDQLTMLPDRIVTDPSILRQLRRAYWNGRRSPLGGVSISAKFMLIDVNARFRDLQPMKRAVDLICSTDSTWNERFENLVKMIVPLRTIGRKARIGGVGFSTELAKGAVFLSVPRIEDFAAEELSINLAHEMGHQALGIFQAGDRIVAGDLGTPVYSAVRRTMRPAIHSFHAMVALAYMVEYLSKRIESPTSLSERQVEFFRRRYAELNADLNVAVGALKDLEFTKIGASLFHECCALAFVTTSVGS